VIVSLSQEWSLLSPHTAFLVLESEQDYQRWGLDRRVRRRYWKPAEARPEAPLPPKWVEQFRLSQRSGPSDQNFAEAVRNAREALAAKDFARAHQLLRAVASYSQAVKSDEFQILRRQALEGLRSRAAAEQREARRGLVDPASPSARPDFQPSVTTLLGSAFRADPDFVRRHPYAERLLQQVDMATLAQGRTLQQFAEELAELTGANVRLDRKALDDIGVNLDERLEGDQWREESSTSTRKPSGDPFASPGHADPFGGSVTDAQRTVRRTTRGAPGRISLKSGSRFLLRQLGLVLVEGPNQLLITTPEGAESRLTTEVYPVADLLFTDRTTPPWLLANPYLDQQERVRQRLASKLKRRVTIQCLERPLAEVVADMASMLDDIVLIDHQSLDDVGVDDDSPITASFRDVPAGQALEWLLND
jgi:hypothetical protein